MSPRTGRPTDNPKGVSIHVRLDKECDETLKEYLLFSNYYAANSTTKKGAICSMPERREIVDLIDVGRNAIHQF